MRPSRFVLMLLLVSGGCSEPETPSTFEQLSMSGASSGTAGAIHSSTQNTAGTRDGPATIEPMVTPDAGGAGGTANVPETDVQRRLYVASPGIRNYVEWGGKGVLIYDIDNGHEFVRRIPSPFDDPDGNVENIKGIVAHAETARLYITTLKRLAAIDLLTEQVLWLKSLDRGCDRPALSQDGRWLYVPSFESDRWYVVDAENGQVEKTLITDQRAHNTVAPPGGDRVYMAGLGSNTLKVADPATHQLLEEEFVGPFSREIRPFAISWSKQLAVVNVNDLLGFEVGSLETGEQLYRVEVPGFQPGPVKRHGTVSHGVGITPGDEEIWVVDAPNQHIHIFDFTVLPPVLEESIELRVDQPGWITFTIDGDYAYPSTGEVIDTDARAIIAHLKDEGGAQVQSEKLVEIDFVSGQPTRVGDQFGVGRSHL